MIGVATEFSEPEPLGQGLGCIVFADFSKARIALSKLAVGNEASQDSSSSHWIMAEGWKSVVTQRQRSNDPTKASNQP